MVHSVLVSRDSNTSRRAARSCAAGASGGAVLALLVRHGQTDANLARAFLGRRDPPLNAAGRREAEAIATALRKSTAAPGLVGVHASDLVRAWETAEIIGQATGAPLVAEPDLREMDIGRLDGLSVDEGRERYPDFFAEWRRSAGRCRMPGGETLQEVRERAWSVLTAQAERHPSREVVFVTHTFVVLAIVCKVLGLPLDRFRGLHVGTGSLTVVRFGAARPCLLAMNVRPDGGWSEGYFR